MPPEICEHHIGLANDVAVIKNDVSYIRSSIDKKDERFNIHVKEAEQEGGRHDQIRDNSKDIIYLKKQISEIKKSKWQSGAIGGAVVFVLTKSPEIGSMLLIFITKMVFAGQ